MSWGLKNRLSRIIQPKSKKTVMLALDHGYFLGPTTKLENPRKTIEPLIPFTDALMLTRGVLRNCFDSTLQRPVVLRVSGGTSIIGSDLSNEGIATSMKEAVRLNASAIALSIFVGTPNEKETLLNLSKMVDEGEEFGMPVLAVTAVGKELEKREARYIALCCRIAAELGAHFVKTYYCENFEKVVEGCPVPVVIAGGPRLDTKADVFKLVFDAIQSGAAGVDMGRNIWQSEHPIPMIKAIRSIVHDGTTQKEALEIFKTNAKST